MREKGKGKRKDTDNKKKKKDSLFLKLSSKGMPTLQDDTQLLREGIACSKCASLSAKCQPNSQWLQE